METSVSRPERSEIEAFAGFAESDRLRDSERRLVVRRTATLERAQEIVAEEEVCRDCEG